MNQLLDLCLTLTPPNADAPEGTIANIEVRCDALGLQPMNVQPLRDQFTPKERSELEWYLEEYWKWPYEEFAERGQRVEQLLTDAGRRLYRAVFDQAQTIVQPWRLQPNAQRQLSIISKVPQALSLPWELLCDEQGFLALRARNPVSIIRRLPQAELGALPMQFTLPLRVLLVTARPDDAGFVDPRGIARELLDEVQPQIEAGAIALEFLRPPTLAALRERLSQQPPIHILHFDGHGTFDEAEAPDDGQRLQGGAQGKLAFEDDDGKCDLVEAERLAQLLQDSGVRLAVLTACQSARGAADDLFSSVAARLIRSGVDGVVAMSASVLVASAAKYVEAFYRKLAAGDAVTLAHERARQALHDDPRRHWHQRHRDKAGAQIKLKDWWLPHFYLQRPIGFVVGQTVSLPARSGATSGSAEALAAPAQTDSLRNLPPPPLYGFTGRARELQQIERWLLGNKLVVIHGFGGVGKTALAREAADWLLRTKMYGVVCFVSFEHGGDASSLLSALGHQLGVDFDPREIPAALDKLKQHVQSTGFSRNARNTNQPPEGGTQNTVLIIADNLESILPGGEVALDSGGRGQLWDVLLALRAAGAGVLATSRDAEFGAGQMAHGKDVKHLPLRGLHPEDAYTLARQLLKDLDIAETRAPYPELRDLLVKLDHHPLAMQLVLTALRDDGQLTIERISAEFARLLPRFSDDRQTGRNRSLLASLDYSLRRLTETERQLLARLAPFEGGAKEEYLLSITEIAEKDWLGLRQALERAALIRPEQIGNFTAPFLRFHPVLMPYLRAQSETEDEVLQSRYAACYRAVANYLDNEDTRNPQAVRELARCEMPNLRRALKLLLASNTLDAPLDLEYCIARFLTIFGLWRERGELRLQVTQAIKTEDKGTASPLTKAEYLRESGIGDDEFARGNYRAAYNRLTALRERIEELPIGTPLGQGSQSHCLTLHRIARCMRAVGQSSVAQGHLREALTHMESLVAKEPNDEELISQCGALLSTLSSVLSDQGKVIEAWQACETGLEIAKQVNDLTMQGVILGQLGQLAFAECNYGEACRRTLETLAIFSTLDDPTNKANAWTQLGLIALEQQQWFEAERCYRTGLEMVERLGDVVTAVGICNQLAIIAVKSDRPDEAEGWFKRVLKMSDLVPPLEAGMYNNLAELLKREVRAERMPPERLAEARGYAEQALKIREKLDASAKIWMTESVLADIAELEGKTEIERSYRRRARESFAAFAGNRWHIDQQFGELLPILAAAVWGDEEARAAVETMLPQLEADGWHISAAVARLYAGERDWHALTEELDRQDALLVLRVLETMEEIEKE